MESRVDWRFQVACDKEFYLWDIIHTVEENRENCGGGFFILTLIEDVNDDGVQMLVVLSRQMMTFFILETRNSCQISGLAFKTCNNSQNRGC